MTEERSKEMGANGANGAGLTLALGGCALAAAAILAAMAAGLGSRLGLWHFRTGFAILTWSAYGGLAATALSLAAGLLSLKKRQIKNFLLALLGVGAGALVAGIPICWKLTVRQLPMIHDITTDLDRPPQFVAILPLRQNAPNPATYGGIEVAMEQRKAYPDLRTLILNQPASEAFPRVLETAKAMGWRIVDSVPAEGRIEATDTTFWFGFTDDIVIRITPAENRSLVDIRSVSRVGKSDVGTNAKRIRAFMKRLSG